MLVLRLGSHGTAVGSQTVWSIAGLARTTRDSSGLGLKVAQCGPTALLHSNAQRPLQKLTIPSDGHPSHLLTGYPPRIPFRRHKLPLLDIILFFVGIQTWLGAMPGLRELSAL